MDKITLADIATIGRGYMEPAEPTMRFNDKPAVGIAISVSAKATEKINRLDVAMQKKLSELTNKRGDETFWAAHEALLESFSAGG